MRRAGVRVAEFVVRIAPRAHDVLLEARRHLQGRRGLAHLQAPRIVLQRFGGGAGERAPAGRHRAGQRDAAPSSARRWMQAVAGDVVDGCASRRCRGACVVLMIASPGGWDVFARPSRVSLAVSSGILRPSTRRCLAAATALRLRCEPIGKDSRCAAARNESSPPTPAACRARRKVVEQLLAGKAKPRRRPRRARCRRARGRRRRGREAEGRRPRHHQRRRAGPAPTTPSTSSTA